MQPVHALSLLVTLLAAGASAQEVRIANVRDLHGLPTARQYEKVEIAFDVEGAAEANPYLPYDLEPAPGLATGVGITVDGLFLPPGRTDWSQAAVQPAFYYQPMKEDMPGGVGYPVGDAGWRIRFAPDTIGKWQWRIRVQDAAVCEDGRRPEKWVQSEPREFAVRQAEPARHGYVTVSPKDPRYFCFSDGTDFPALGLAGGAGEITRDPDAYFTEISRHGIDLIRTWMCSDLIAGRGTHGWDPWRGVESRERAGTADGVTPYRYHDFAIRLTRNGRHIAITGNQAIKTWLEKDTKYILRIRAKLDGIVGTGVEPSGLVVKFLNDPYSDDFLSEKNTKLLLTPEGWKGTTDWQVFEAPFANPLGRRAIGHGAGLAIGLQDVSAGSVYFDEIYLGEDLGGGKVGPNILFKGQLNYHLYFDQIASHLWDRVYESAQRHGVYIKPVILEKNDPIYNGISRIDGIFRPIEKDNDNFYAGPGTKVRRLHEYYWRYLAARWGYCTAIHSWELLNEGDPGSKLHYDQADAMKQAISRWDRNHMASTSFWHSFPTEFWRQTACDYADVHAYISTTYAKAERPAMQQDAAWYRLWHSRDIFINRNPGKPVILGEAGLDFPDRQDRNPLLEKDKQGVWFHNFLWAGLDAGSLYQIYWWTEDLTNRRAGFDHRVEYSKLRRFMADLDLAGGNYQDWAGECDNPNVRVVGQKNLAKGRFHLWLQNKQHTWKNVVEGGTLDTQSASITIAGFEPGMTFRVEWWDPWTGAVIETQQITVIDELVVRPPRGIRTDVAVKGYFVQRGVPRREGQQ